MVGVGDGRANHLPNWHHGFASRHRSSCRGFDDGLREPSPDLIDGRIAETIAREVQFPHRVAHEVHQAKILDLFFGQYGLGGVARSAASSSAAYWNQMILGDGYYELDLELDPAQPTVETKLFFYRLLGDVNGDHVVDGNDTYQIAMAESDSTIFGDANGDGSVDTTDANLAARSKAANRRLGDGLHLDA